MTDIDFLSSDGKDGDKRTTSDKAENEDMQMHVPDALQEEADEKDGGRSLFGGMKGQSPKKDDDAIGGDLLHPHDPEVRIEPPKPKVSVPDPKPEVSEAPPRQIPAPPVPKPSVPPPPPPTAKPISATLPETPEQKNGVSTLRVSLLGGEGGTTMTDLTVRARFKTFIIVLILSVAMDAIIYGGILVYKSQVIKNIQEISAGVGDLDLKIGEIEKRVVPAQEFQKISALSETLLERHLHWTYFLSLLESLTLTEVQFIDLSGIESGAVSANVIARDYTTLAKQIIALEAHKGVSRAALSSATAEFTNDGLLLGASAAFQVEFDPKVLFDSPPVTPPES